MKKTLFLILSGCIVIFSIICICCGPIITGVIPRASIWRTQNCQQKADLVKDYEDQNKDKDTIKDAKRARNKCNREKAMYGLEYSSLIVDVICGFVCTILGLLHYFDVAKPFEKVTGIIGLATGIIGFVLTFVYLVYSAYIFTNDPYQDEDDEYIYKRDGDWAFAKTEDGKLKCLFYKEGKVDSILARYSDLGKKQYNYNRKQIKQQSSTCSESSSFPPDTSDPTTPIPFALECAGSQYLVSPPSTCETLYIKAETEIFNKYLFDKWVTTIIFSCFIIVCDIGLAIFGFLLFKSDGSGI